MITTSSSSTDGGAQSQHTRSITDTLMAREYSPSFFFASNRKKLARRPRQHKKTRRAPGALTFCVVGGGSTRTHHRCDPNASITQVERCVLLRKDKRRPKWHAEESSRSAFRVRFVFSSDLMNSRDISCGVLRGFAAFQRL